MLNVFHYISILSLTDKASITTKRFTGRFARLNAIVQIQRTRSSQIHNQSMLFKPTQRLGCVHIFCTSAHTKHVGFLKVLSSNTTTPLYHSGLAKFNVAVKHAGEGCHGRMHIMFVIKYFFEVIFYRVFVVIYRHFVGFINTHSCHIIIKLITKHYYH